MKEQLCETEREIQRLLLKHKSDNISSNNNSPNSSIFSMEQPHFLGEFGMEGILMDDNMYCVADDQSTYMTLWDD